MKHELEKNREIKRIGGGLEAVDQDEGELQLINKQVHASVLTKLVRDFTSLEILDLSGNNIGDDGSKDIAIMIKENKTIKRLILENCHIGTKGLQRIA